MIFRSSDIAPRVTPPTVRRAYRLLGDLKEIEEGKEGEEERERGREREREKEREKSF